MIDHEELREIVADMNSRTAVVFRYQLHDLLADFDQLKAQLDSLLNAAKAVVGRSTKPPKVTWTEDGSPIVDCHDDVNEFLANWTALEAAIIAITKGPLT